MEVINIEKTKDTPKIILDKDNSIFEISERSLPENAIDFYKPVIDWFTEYSKNPNHETVVNFKLEYFNTASAKQIAKILLLLQNIAKNNNVLIKWHYQKDDLDMKASGVRYSKLVKVNFEFIEED
jgi:hypothetical protein